MSLEPDKSQETLLQACMKDATIDGMKRDQPSSETFLPQVEPAAANFNVTEILKEQDRGPRHVIRTNLPTTLGPQGASRDLPAQKNHAANQNVGSAFQRLGFAYEVLKSSASRRRYDLASNSAFSNTFAGHAASLDGERTFRNAVEAILHEFMTGDFVLVRRGLGALNHRYPNLMSDQVITTVEKSFVRIRELVLTTKSYALLVYIELRRIHRVQRQLMGLGYLDVFGRARLTVHLVRVTLAVPVRVDRALRQREESEWRAKTAGYYAAGLTLPEPPRRAGFLNEKVGRILEFLVGQAGQDEDVNDPFHVETNTACI
ncbi:MAG: hypothetical protein M1816_001404 [Peltula sp. TS41687]|nr:MAG: hypothetical protein M1816_001404 [Peltula sp. TS41687]